MSANIPEMSRPCPCTEQTTWGRREVIAGAAAVLVAGHQTVRADDKEPKALRPQPGDQLVFLSGDNKGQKILSADLKVGDAPKLAYPIDPQSGVVRSGSRANQILVAKVDPALLPDSMKSQSQEGVVAYSSICTHNGCPITVLGSDQRSVVCNCHGSVFDLADNGKVLEGPASRRLSALPVSVSEGVISVSGAFSGAIGPQKQ